MNRLFFVLLVTILSKCESKNASIKQLIHKGYEVGIHEFSYATFLHLENRRPASCGASLILVQAVITAASCVDILRYRRGKIYAHFGATVPKDSQVVREMVNYRVNPKYDEGKGRNNIAIGFLDRRVPLRHEIKKVPLVGKDPPVGSEVWSVGWGKQVFGKLPDFSKWRSLKATKQQVMSSSECTRYAGFKLSSTSLCSRPLKGHLYKDDAGNGLIVRQPSHRLVGVFSFVHDEISVYTSVLAHKNWIGNTCRELYRETCLGQG